MTLEIRTIHLSLIAIPLRMKVEHALAERSLARNLVVCVEDGNGRKGYGECCPRDYVTGETLDSVWRDVKQHLAPHFLGQRYADFGAVVEALAPMGRAQPRNRLAAFCALELALLDLAGQVSHCSAGDAIGPVMQTPVYYSGVIASSQREQVKQMTALMQQYGFRQVKVKLGSDLATNQRILQTVRQQLPESVELRGDANAAWDAQQAIRQLEALKPFKLAGIEQPVPGDDLAGMQAVTQADITPVVADESLCSYDDGLNLIQNRGCHIFNLRVSKCGGLLNTGRLFQLADQHSIGCQLGAQVGETGLLSAAGRHIASRCVPLRWFEGCYGRYLMEDEIASPDLTLGERGEAHALTAHGLGVTINTDKLKQYQERGETLSA